MLLKFYAINLDLALAVDQEIFNNTKIGTVVPLHKELKIGTLKNALKLAKVDETEFAEFI